MIDMYFYVQQLKNAIKKEDWKQVTSSTSLLVKELKNQETSPSVIFTSEKQRLVTNIRKVAESLLSAASSTDKSRVREASLNLMNLFDALFSNTVVYLLRHPEKTTQKGRVLTDVGVKQVQEYASLLVNEILLCPKNVTVVMSTSEIPRTQKFAQLVAYRLKKLAEMQGRRVSIENKGFDYRLAFRFTPEEIGFLGKTAQEKGLIVDYGFVQFSDWLANADLYLGKFPKLHHPAPIVRDLQDFVSWSRREWVSTGHLWQLSPVWGVVLGFTHSWILDAFRVHYAGKDVKDIVRSGGFVKIDGNQIFIDGKWYQYM